jgi:hypothetical protein
VLTAIYIGERGENRTLHSRGTRLNISAVVAGFLIVMLLIVPHLKDVRPHS